MRISKNLDLSGRYSRSYIEGSSSVHLFGKISSKFHFSRLSRKFLGSPHRPAPTDGWPRCGRRRGNRRTHHLCASANGSTAFGPRRRRRRRAAPTKSFRRSATLSFLYIFWFVLLSFAAAQLLPQHIAGRSNSAVCSANAVFFGALSPATSMCFLSRIWAAVWQFHSRVVDFVCGYDVGERFASSAKLRWNQS